MPPAALWVWQGICWGPMATNPQFAEEISRGIKEMLLDTEDLKVTRGVEGKEAKFMAALYGMNAGEQK